MSAYGQKIEAKNSKQNSPGQHRGLKKKVPCCEDKENRSHAEWGYVFICSVKQRTEQELENRKKKKKKSLEDGLMYCPDGSVITPLAPCWQINGREPIYKICMPFFCSPPILYSFLFFSIWSLFIVSLFLAFPVPDFRLGEEPPNISFP